MYNHVLFYLNKYLFYPTPPGEHCSSIRLGLWIYPFESFEKFSEGYEIEVLVFRDPDSEALFQITGFLCLTGKREHNKSPETGKRSGCHFRTRSN